jgi:hypothetical protein
MKVTARRSGTTLKPSAMPEGLSVLPVTEEAGRS